MPLNLPPPRTKGYYLKAEEDWNQVLKCIGQLESLHLGTSKGPTERFIGMIVDQGPAGESDYSDSRYWVQRKYVLVDDSDLTASWSGHLGDFGNPSSDWIVTATNVDELPYETHNLAYSELVIVFRAIDASPSEPVYRYYFSKSLGNSFWGRIESSVSETNNWKYVFKKVTKSDVGFGKTKWTVDTSFGSDYAYNLREVDGHANGPTPSDIIVRMWPVNVPSGTSDPATLEYWFDYQRARSDVHLSTSDYLDNRHPIYALRLDANGNIIALYGMRFAPTSGLGWIDLDGNSI